jgi:hypothetical protein
MDDKFGHPLNNPVGNKRILSVLNITVSKLVQNRKLNPVNLNDVTLLGIVIEVKLIQKANAAVLIDVIVFGKVTDVKLIHL